MGDCQMLKEHLHNSKLFCTKILILCFGMFNGNMTVSYEFLSFLFVINNKQNTFLLFKIL